MNLPKHRLPDTHCRVCGAQLEVEHPGRTRLRGLFDRRQWQANMVCPRCGVRTGGGRSVTLTSRHPPRNPFMRLIFQIGQFKNRRQYARLTDSLGTSNPFAGDDGHMDLARLLAPALFPVYGLKGRPMGLRLKSWGGGGHGTPLVTDNIHLGYVVGHPSQPEKAVDINQGPAVDSDVDELGAIESLVHNYSSEERQESYFHQGNFHRDWNIERLQNTPHQQATIQVGDMNVEVRFSSWDEPQRVILARLTLSSLNTEDHPLQVASLNTSWEELQEALTTLVLLQEDQETVADYQQDLDEVRRQLFGHHDK